MLKTNAHPNWWSLETQHMYKLLSAPSGFRWWPEAWALNTPEPVVQTSALFTTLCKKYHCSILLDNRAQRIVTLLRNGTRKQSPHGQEPKRMSGDLGWHLFPKCQWEKHFYCDSISPLLKGNDKNTSPQNEEGLLVILPHFQAIGKAWRLVCSLAQARGGPKDSSGRSFP